MFLLGFDIGSSSVKASIINVATGECVGAAHSPNSEMEISAPQRGWAEQHPDLWWENLQSALKIALFRANIKGSEISAIGISYQMHGLVCIDKTGAVLRPSIIWCDSRAVEIGGKAFNDLGNKTCLEHLLNSPGNFTASKLKWVKENEPSTYQKIHKIMLPGDYIAYKLSGEINTTETGLSEGILWDFKNNSIADLLLNHYGISKELIPTIVPSIGNQSVVSKEASKLLGLNEGIPISYRAGDQPNNAFSLNVLQPGEIAATAGTSGVVYGVTDRIKYDPKSRINTFAHVNHKEDLSRLGILLCINGTGILNSWVRKNMANSNTSYQQMNELASKIAIGSDGLIVLPFGNGAERMLENKIIGTQFLNIDLNKHASSHIYRAIQEGIAFSFRYGIDIMKSELGMTPSVIRAGNANMFLSPIFSSTLSNVTGATIELFETDGAAGAARGAGIGAGIYKNSVEAFISLRKLSTIEPNKALESQYMNLYGSWLNALKKYTD